MTLDDQQGLEIDFAFSEALGHIRNATAKLLGVEQDTTSLLLGISGLDLQTLFGDVWPAYIEDDLTIADSLAEAQRILDQVIDQVPLGLWSALRSLRERVGDGDR